MFLSHKSNVIQFIDEVEWNCRRKTKGLTKDEYFTWLDSVTSGDPPVVDYSGETGYTIIECTDEDVSVRLEQLGDYVSSDSVGTTYNIKYYASKRDAEEILDIDGKSHDPKQYVQSHFVGDDSAKDARLLADEWKMIRAERNRLIAETDWMMLSDTGTVSTAWKNYRKALREIPQSQDSVKKYADIDWPDKPSS
jgi:hypothetical protein